VDRDADAAAVRVFWTDETSLRARSSAWWRERAQKPAAQTILAAVDAATNAPDRGRRYVANKGFFTRDMFELLTADPIEVRELSPPRVRVAARAPLLPRRRGERRQRGGVVRGLAMAPFGLPNSGAPAIPILEVRPDPVTPTAARVRLRVPAGAVPAVEFRLRRSQTSARDVLAMPIAASGMVPAASLTPVAGEPDTAMQHVDITDIGASELEPAGVLRFWQTYSWRAEVRGAPEPGGGPAGEWSLPSPAVALTIVPPAPPASATIVSVTVVSVAPAGTGVEVRAKHPDPLRGGALGEYHLDFYARAPGGDELMVGSLSADTPAAPAAATRTARDSSASRCPRPWRRPAPCSASSSSTRWARLSAPSAPMQAP
jgi:hypothetical protein